MNKVLQILHYVPPTQPLPPSPVYLYNLISVKTPDN